jgi:two-component system OmpR family response regulator
MEMRLLIVEGEPETAGHIRRALTGEGTTTDAVGRGEDAVRMAASVHYDVVILSLRLPGMDGLATCRRLRADGISSPVLMLSHRATVEDRIAGLNAGADAYLPSPATPAELSARVRALMRRGPLRRVGG